MKRAIHVCTLGLLLFALGPAGCVWKYQYDALVQEHNQLKTRLVDATAQSTQQQASMNSALNSAQANLTALVSERDALRNELGVSQRNLADIRGRVEQMWTIMQTIMSTRAPMGSYQQATIPPGAPPAAPRRF